MKTSNETMMEEDEELEDVQLEVEDEHVTHRDINITLSQNGVTRDKLNLNNVVRRYSLAKSPPL